MHVMFGVSVALLGADSARLDARLKYAPRQLWLECRLAGHDTTCGFTDVGAVEIDPDASDELLNHVLGEACVRAAGARCGAAEACFDAPRKRLMFDAR